MSLKAPFEKVLDGLSPRQRDRILHPKTRDRIPSLSLALSLFLPSLETPDELITPQSIDIVG